MNKNFFLQDEQPIDDKNRVRMENLSYPSDEVAYNVLQYISCEGRLNIVYEYHFIFLYHIIFQVHFLIQERLRFPRFLLQSIK